VTDLFDGFDVMPYMTFIEGVKRLKGGQRPSANAPKVPVVVDQYRKFTNKRRSWPDADLVMLDAAIADQLGAFLRHPVADEIERAAMEPDDLIFIQQSRRSIEYHLVRKAG
jgi:hypothetical protein